MLECSTSMSFSCASKDSVFFVHNVAMLDFESTECRYYYYILLGYCGESTERDQLGRYRSGWVKWVKGGRGNENKTSIIFLTSGSCAHLLWLMCCTSDQGIQVWALVEVASAADVREGLSCVPALWNPKNICGGGYSWGHCVVFLGETLYTLTEPYSTQVYKWVPAN